MKFFSIMHKNFLLLWRSKLSLLAILFGPLIIILLIGLAFTATSTTEFKVGIVVPDYTELASKIISNMEADGFIIEEFPSNVTCSDEVKEGMLQTCILFPPDFRLENDKVNELIFIVDSSRMNLVYQIIDSVSSNIGVATTELSKDLTNTILLTLTNTEQGIDQVIADVIALKQRTGALSESTAESTSNLESLDLSEASVNTDDVSDAHTLVVDLITTLQTQSQAVIDDGEALVDELADAGYSGNATSGFKSSLNTFKTSVSTSTSEANLATESFTEAIDQVSASLTDLNSRLGSAAETRDVAKEKLNAVKEGLDGTYETLDEIKTLLEGLAGEIDNLKVTSSETISQPIVTSIQSVATKKNQLSFTFPYLLMLVVLFIGLMLSGTLIVMEKSSRASFRSFSTPTSNGLFMATHFLTSFLVLTLQISILIGLAYLFLGSALIVNIGVTVPLILLTIILFTLLGMGVGYLFSTLEAVTMVSISLGVLFIFLSNLIIPLENLAPKLQSLSIYNPYVIASEALRKAMLFSSTFTELQTSFITLVAYSAIILVLTIVLRDLAKSRFIIHVALIKRKHIFQQPEDAYLQVGDEYIKTVPEFLEWLKNSSDDTFARFLHHKDLRIWLVHQQKKRFLARQLFGKSRKQIIRILERRLKTSKSRKKRSRITG